MAAPLDTNPFHAFTLPSFSLCPLTEFNYMLTPPLSGQQIINDLTADKAITGLVYGLVLGLAAFVVSILFVFCLARTLLRLVSRSAGVVFAWVVTVPGEIRWGIRRLGRRLRRGRGGMDTGEEEEDGVFELVDLGGNTVRAVFALICFHPYSTTDYVVDFVLMDHKHRWGKASSLPSGQRVSIAALAVCVLQAERVAFGVSPRTYLSRVQQAHVPSERSSPMVAFRSFHGAQYSIARSSSFNGTSVKSTSPILMYSGIAFCIMSLPTFPKWFLFGNVFCFLFVTPT
ncbi:hypothetical protein N657DRAFT_395878 [Parathielavia appendiculata]|uniref:Uncharacterized protein n=1 Tax=Parathielavia appendiculata TaxID=2587402 RepID=A0AAN6Z451_9PEZI|nr:hypothetical protein N657DRAFT_395878 [Parathielavia appendiculata]